MDFDKIAAIAITAYVVGFVGHTIFMYLRFSGYQRNLSMNVTAFLKFLASQGALWIIAILAIVGIYILGVLELSYYETIPGILFFGVFVVWGWIKHIYKLPRNDR